MNNSNYIGKKGYTLKKTNLTQTQLYELRNDLTVKPNTGLCGHNTNISYPVYRESQNKIYIPRHYGIEKYGPVSKNCVSVGSDINVEFTGNLFDYQINIVNKFLNNIKQNDNCGGGLLDIEPGKGKTVMALNIISKLKKKTLVVVHKSFLLNQWKERINQFLPNAKIGYIQGKITDVEDKDIVIGMLQTLSRNELIYDIVEEFGLTVYDECHHLSAEVFSRVMININSNIALGLSGSMTRKDGLTKVFKWFIGPIIHKEKTENQEEVLIKVVNYEDFDEEYNNVETDFRGNPQYSKMITKLCMNENRTDMIVNIVEKELKDVENVNQIMILAHNKNLITSLFEKIIAFEPSVGYYIGGMKEEHLKISESKKVLIATYAMASEGLDIKTLTTLIMATPKTDVCQSVGRILRSKHSRPLVVDVVDSHEIFKRQSVKRKKYYNQKKYKIQNYKNLNCYLINEFVILDSKKTKKKKVKCLVPTTDSAF